MLLENKNAVIYGGGGETAVWWPVPSLAEVGNVAVLMASDHAGSMTGTVANTSCGQIVD